MSCEPPWICMDASGCDWTQPLATCENPVHDAVHFGFCIGGKLLLINELGIGCCSLRPLHTQLRGEVLLVALSSLYFGHISEEAISGALFRERK